METTSPASESAAVATEGQSAPTPAAAPSSESTASTPAQSSPAQANPGGAASAQGQENYERRVFELLDAGKSVADARKEALEPDPAAAAPDSERGSTAAQANGTAFGEPTGRAAAKTEPEGEEVAPDAGGPGFQGLDGPAKQAIQQAQLLPDPVIWNQMTAAQRQNLLNASREIVANRSRQFQQQRQTPGQRQQARDEQGRFTNNTPDEAGDSPESPNIEAGAPPQGRQPPQAATPPRDDRQAAAAPQQRPQLPQRLRDFAANLGDDLGKPLLEGLEELANSHHQESQQLREQLSQFQEAGQQQMRAVLASEEGSTRQELAKDLPALASDDARWAMVRNNALALADTQYRSTGTWNWGACLKSAAQFLFHSDIRQEAQRSLAAKARTALRGTPERAPGTGATPNAALAGDAWDEMALAQLDQGKTVEQVRGARLAG